MLLITAPQWQKGHLMALPDLLALTAHCGQGVNPNFPHHTWPSQLFWHQKPRLTHSFQGMGASGLDLGTEAQTQPPEPDGPTGCPLGGHRRATAEGEESRREGHMNTLCRVESHVTGRAFNGNQKAPGKQLIHWPHLPLAGVSASMWIARFQWWVHKHSQVPPVWRVLLFLFLLVPHTPLQTQVTNWPSSVDVAHILSPFQNSQGV